MRARAQALVTLELGPVTDLERTAKLMNEVEQERFTYIDRTLLARSKDGIVVVTTAGKEHPVRHTMRIGRLKKLEQLGLAEERRAGVWSLDPKVKSKLRQLGERADTFKMMQRALKDAGIERPAPGLALFESGRRHTPVLGKVVAVGLVDEITDRQYVIVDGADGRVHYAELGRLAPAEAPARGMIVSLTGDSLQGKPKSTPRLTVLSPVELARQVDYDGPTWLDRVLIARERLHASPTGFGWSSTRRLPTAVAGLASRSSPKSVLTVACAPRRRCSPNCASARRCGCLKRFRASSTPCMCRTSREAACLVFTSARSAPPPANLPSSAARTLSRWPRGNQPRADAGPRGQRHDPAAPGLVDVGSRARTGSLKHVILCGDTVLRLLLLGAPRPGEAATGPYRAAVPRARAPPECALVARLRQRAAGLGPYG